MTYRALIATTASSNVLLGCATTPSGQTAAQTREPGFETKARAFAQEYASMLCSSPCPVRILVLDGCDIRPQPLTVGLPRGRHNVPIQWTIDPASVGGA